MEIIFIGHNFYIDSGTRMSPYYCIFSGDSWGRFTIGDIENALISGETLTIRPANEQELIKAQSMLIALRDGL